LVVRATDMRDKSQFPTARMRGRIKSTWSRRASKQTP